MATEKLTDPLDDLRELAHAHSTLQSVGGLGGAAQIMRNEQIAQLYNRGVSVSRIAHVAGVDRTWPYTVAKTYPGDRAEFDRKHPDLVELLLAARKSINFLLRLAREDTLAIETDEPYDDDNS